MTPPRVAPEPALILRGECPSLSPPPFLQRPGGLGGSPSQALTPRSLKGGGRTPPRKDPAAGHARFGRLHRYPALGDGRETWGPSSPQSQELPGIEQPSWGERARLGGSGVQEWRRDLGCSWHCRGPVGGSGPCSQRWAPWGKCGIVVVVGGRKHWYGTGLGPSQEGRELKSGVGGPWQGPPEQAASLEPSQSPGLVPSEDAQASVGLSAAWRPLPRRNARLCSRPWQLQIRCDASRWGLWE